MHDARAAAARFPRTLEVGSGQITPLARRHVAAVASTNDAIARGVRLSCDVICRIARASNDRRRGERAYFEQLVAVREHRLAARRAARAHSAANDDGIDRATTTGVGSAGIIGVGTDALLLCYSPGLASAGGGAAGGRARVRRARRARVRAVAARACSHAGSLRRGRSDASPPCISKSITRVRHAALCRWLL